MTGLKISRVRQLIREELQSYIVRGGQHVLTRREDGKKSWQWHTTQKVQYFTADELVSGPRTPTAEPVWVFRRGDWLVALKDENFFQRPEWNYPQRF